VVRQFLKKAFKSCFLFRTFVMALCVEHTTNVYRVQQKKAFKIMCRRMPFENVHLTLGLYEDKNVLA